MNLYLDDDTSKSALVARLRKAGHEVTVPSDASLSGAADARRLLHAVQQGLVVLSKNHDDFQDHLLIGATHGRHTGILIIRFDNDASRDMKDAEIVRAVGNLERAGAPIANELHIHWR